jgi:integrase/recombinase XerD
MMDNPEPRIRVGTYVTIYPRGKKKVYCADFWRDGKHCRQSLKTSNIKVARHRASIIDGELAAGTFQSPLPQTTIAAAVADFVAFNEAEGKAPTTRRRYRNLLGHLQTFLAGLGVTKLHHFAASHFDRFRAGRTHHHASTQRSDGVMIKHFFEWCKNRKLMRENPIKDVKIPLPPFQPKEGPNVEQIERIIDAVPGYMRIPMAVLAYAGMRPGEARNLMPDDIDFEGNWIHVRSRKGRETKNRHSRKIPIHHKLLPFLKELPSKPRTFLLTMSPCHEDPLGIRPLCLMRLNMRLAKALKAMGLPAGRAAGFTLHSMRRSFETLTVNQGIPQAVIDTWMGHRSNRSIGRVYYHLRDADSQKFMRKVRFEVNWDSMD